MTTKGPQTKTTKRQKYQKDTQYDHKQLKKTLQLIKIDTKWQRRWPQRQKKMTRRRNIVSANNVLVSFVDVLCLFQFGGLLWAQGHIFFTIRPCNQESKTKHIQFIFRAECQKPVDILTFKNVSDEFSVWASFLNTHITKPSKFPEIIGYWGLDLSVLSGSYISVPRHPHIGTSREAAPVSSAPVPFGKSWQCNGYAACVSRAKEMRKPITTTNEDSYLCRPLSVCLRIPCCSAGSAVAVLPFKWRVML